jgi:hypothetical protein
MRSREFNSLRKLRLFNSLSLADVAKFYRARVTRSRIFAIEGLERVSHDVERDYRRAVAAAIANRDELNRIIKIARELAKTG